MRGTVSKEDLQFDPEIEKTARLLKKQAKEAKRLARLAQPGSSSSIHSPSGSVQTLSPGGSLHTTPPSSPERETIVTMANEDENALPSWVSPRRLANLGNQNAKQV